MTALSPGILSSSFELLGMFARGPATLKEFSASFPRVGVCWTADVLEFALGVFWIRPSDSGVVELTASGRRILVNDNHESRMKQSVLDYVDEFEPPWVQNATFGRRKVLDFVGADVRQVFDEAGLSTGQDGETIRFWDTLAAWARGQKDIGLSQIGRRGESLTIAMETERTGCEPRWVSVDNNADGYDVLSVVAAHDRQRLSIEVKATTVGPRGLFHVTRNEWDRAIGTQFHCFHLWMLQGENDRDSAVAVIDVEQMLPHAPIDRGAGSWSSFEVPFAAFAAHFENAAPEHAA